MPLSIISSYSWLYSIGLFNSNFNLFSFGVEKYSHQRVPRRNIFFHTSYIDYLNLRNTSANFFPMG